MKNLDLLIHDMNNILFSISGMIVSGNKEEAQEKLEKIFGSYQPINENFTPIDYLINAKIKLIRKNKIKFHMDKNIAFPNIDNSEICIIFGNLLDNAIESCTKLEIKKRFIRFKFYKNREEYTYTISNSTGPLNSVNYSNNNNHLGLKIVKKLINKNRGNVKIFRNKKNFKIKIVLCDSKEDNVYKNCNI